MSHSVRKASLGGDTDRDEIPAGAEKSHLQAIGVSIGYPGSGGSGTEVSPAVDRVDLVLSRGDFVCIVGPSGCGKTTFLNAVAGFLPITGGSLKLDGRDIPGPGPDRAMVFQQASLLPWRNVLDNVTYGLELSKSMKRAQARERARDLLDLVGLSAAADQHPGQLSGGMQQRVNLARALAVDPELLLLDEPFASIDAQTREVMQGELLRICAARDVTALFVTHDITEAAFLADRVCVFSPRPGHIVKEVGIPLPRPREQRFRRMPEFTELVDEISDALYGAAGPSLLTNGGSV
ncbi:ABC transporter ATP-binding protein [Amycolatopsis acidiphila]|uniref:ABC transporter ATP-binding protein n=1 Tax=Amycolatopsis acidiphila TaxID=715473 RepID=A0A558AFA1_9PSEU|nr:ABC transporter ATP-binding protein [Amycolatopsis acidiphila]TVT22934.1 ABC transporter ATP-binding protein [Amycolatopsis acidiphila]UIJ57094.1 ABC transporter ATP-binding protein [Amycolatopsis acidiphila]GHG53389.1 ABC transporter ATP-binding protein [Amycolatopsis acidiphila]